MMLEKDRLRTLMYKKNKEHTDLDRQEETVALISSLGKIVTEYSIDFPIAFIAGASEPKLQEFLKDFSQSALVRIRENTLELCLWQGRETDLLWNDKYRIWEPNPVLPSLDMRSLKKNVLLLVPGLAFDKQGARLGRGKGFYDRFIRDFRSTCFDSKIWVCGLCFSWQVLDKVPSESHDMGIDILLSGGDVWVR